MLELADEKINVWVFFKGASIKPFIFFWKGRKIKIESINLVHTSKDGDKLFYHFSVSSGGNYYSLKFDPKDLKWFLVVVQDKKTEISLMSFRTQ
jgi:hypothetical protein